MTDDKNIQDQELPEGQPVPSPKRQLYDKLYQGQLYTKSYEDFDKQFNTPESIDKLYNNLSSSKLYTKSREDFSNQFFKQTTPPKQEKPFSVPTYNFNDFNQYKQPYIEPSNKITGDEKIRQQKQIDQKAASGKMSEKELSEYYQRPSPLEKADKVQQAVSELNDDYYKYSEGAAKNILAKNIINQQIQTNLSKKIDQPAIKALLPIGLQQKEEERIKNNIPQSDIDNIINDPNSKEQLLKHTVSELRKQGNDNEANRIDANLYLYNTIQSNPDPKVAKKITENADKIKEGEYGIINGQLVKYENPLQALKTGYKQRTEAYDLGHDLFFGSEEENIKKLNSIIDKKSNPLNPIPIPRGLAGDVGEFIGAEGIGALKGSVPNVIPIVGQGISMALTGEEMGIRGYADKMVQTYAQLKNEYKQQYPNLNDNEIDSMAYQKANESAATSGLIDAALGAFLAKGGKGLNKSEQLWSREAIEAGKNIPKESINVFKKAVKGGSEFIGDVIKTGAPITGAAGAAQSLKNLNDIRIGLKNKWDDNVGEAMTGMLLLHGLFHGAGQLTKYIKDASSKDARNARELYRAFAKMNPEDVRQIGDNLVSDKLLSRYEADNVVKDIDNYRDINMQIPSHVFDSKSRHEINNKIDEYNKLSEQLKGDKKENAGLHEAYFDMIKQKMADLKEDISILSAHPDDQLSLLNEKKSKLEKHLSEINEAAKKGEDISELGERKKIKDRLKEINNGIKDVNEKLSDPLYKAQQIVAKGKTKGFTKELFEDAAKNDPEKFREYLKEISEQAHSSESERKTTIDTYGEDLVKTAEEMFPDKKEKSSSNEEAIADIERRRQEDLRNNNAITLGYLPIEGFEQRAKDINAKYDAELSALKENPIQPKSSKISIIRPEEINQPSKIVTIKSKQNEPETSITTVREQPTGQERGQAEGIQGGEPEGQEGRPKGGQENNSESEKAEITEEPKTKINAIQERSPEEIPMGKTSGNSGKMGEGIPESKESTGARQQEENKNKTKEESIEPDMTGITHAQMDETAREFGFETYKEDPETIPKWDEEAKERLKNPKAIPDLLDKMEDRIQPTKVEQRMMIQYIASLKTRMRKNATPELLSEYNRAQRLSNIVGGQDVAKSLRARQGSILVEDNLPNYLSREALAYGVETLPQETIDDLAARFNKEQELKQKIDEAYERGKTESLKSKVDENFEKLKKSIKGAKRKTIDEIKSERKIIITDLKDAWNNAGKGMMYSSIIPGTPQAIKLAAITPHILKLTRNIIEQGVSKLDDVINHIHEEIKDALADVSKNDIRNILAGEYSEGKTKSQLAHDVMNMRLEASLLNKIERELTGKEPAYGPAKIKKNARIQELKNKLAELKKTRKTLEKSEGEQINDQSIGNSESVKKRKTYLLNKIEERKAQIKNGEFIPEKKSAPKIVLDKQTKALEDEYIKMQEEDELRRAKADYDRMKPFDKAVDIIGDTMGIKRFIGSALDLSIPGRQGAPITFNIMKWLPINEGGKLTANTAPKAFGKMFDVLFSPRKFKKFMYDINHNDIGRLFIEMGGEFSNPAEIRTSKRDEQYTTKIFQRLGNYLANHDNKAISTSANALEHAWFSERAAAGWTNVARMEEFTKAVKNLNEAGFTPQHDPEMYKDAAKWVMNMTGRGNMVGFLEDSHKGRMLANRLYYGARLMAAKINMLNPVYYAKMPKHILKQAAKDVVGNISTMILTGLAAKAAGFDISLDYDDPDFLQLRYGNKVFDISGGSAAYVRTFLRVGNAIQKLALAPKEKATSKYAAFAGKSAWKSLFVNKLEPNMSYIYHFITNKSGEYDESGHLKDFNPAEIIEIWPMYGPDVINALKDEGAVSLLTVGIPNLMGIGYQNYPDKNTSEEMKSTHRRGSRGRKETENKK